MAEPEHFWSTGRVRVSDRTASEPGAAPCNPVRRMTRAPHCPIPALTLDRSWGRDAVSAAFAGAIAGASGDQRFAEVLGRLVLAATLKDNETGAHLVRISGYCRCLARRFGLAPETAEHLWAAAPLHDVGKIAIPDAVLSKPGPLTAAERRLMQRHTVVGAALLADGTSPRLAAAREIALTHHERWDGSGYPLGLAGDAIPVSGRLAGLADQYDALRSSRPYKPAFSHERTCRILLEGDGRTLPQHFAPEVLEVFRAAAEEFRAIYDAMPDPAAATPAA